MGTIRKFVFLFSFVSPIIFAIGQPCYSRIAANAISLAAIECDIGQNSVSIAKFSEGSWTNEGMVEGPMGPIGPIWSGAPKLALACSTNQCIELGVNVERFESSNDCFVKGSAIYSISSGDCQ